MHKTSQFKAQCKGDISRAFRTAKITVFDAMMCKRPDVPLQAELLVLTIQLRTSQPSIRVAWMGILIQVGHILRIVQMINTAARLVTKGTSGLLHIMGSNTVIFAVLKA